MSQLQERISQFRKMATDDPDNEVGHFSLGKLLFEAGQNEEAVQAVRRAIALNPNSGKFYQLLASALLKQNQRDEAVKTLQEGFLVADHWGQNLPRDEMAKLLTELGAEVPAAKKKAPEPAGSPTAGGFRCQRPDCHAGDYARQLPGPAMNDDLGRRIHASICADCWNDWLRNYSIKVINEMRLDLSTEPGQEVYDQIMRQFLGLE